MQKQSDRQYMRSCTLVCRMEIHFEDKQNFSTQSPKIQSYDNAETVWKHKEAAYGSDCIERLLNSTMEYLCYNIIDFFFVPL